MAITSFQCPSFKDHVTKLVIVEIIIKNMNTHMND
jgi:hypothetical protein